MHTDASHSFRSKIEREFQNYLNNAKGIILTKSNQFQPLPTQTEPTYSMKKPRQFPGKLHFALDLGTHISR